MYALKFLMVAEGEEIIEYAKSADLANAIKRRLNTGAVLVEIIDMG